MARYRSSKRSRWAEPPAGPRRRREDGLSTVEEIEETDKYPPQDTTFVLIEGGSHTNFGLYETQDGDGAATISPAEQRSQTVAATLDLLAAVVAAGA
ncbi:MAG: alpha/beta hydrolase [Candidatus Limnocylindrales bacterium]